MPPGVTEIICTPSTVEPNHLILQIGSNEGHYFKVLLMDARREALDIDKLSMLTREHEEKSFTYIDKASNYVSKEHSKYGAYQNSLEHILHNVDNVKENLTKAESSSRDTDMTKEISKLKKEKGSSSPAISTIHDGPN